MRDTGIPQKADEKKKKRKPLRPPLSNLINSNLSSNTQVKSNSLLRMDTYTEYRMSEIIQRLAKKVDRCLEFCGKFTDRVEIQVTPEELNIKQADSQLRTLEKIGTKFDILQDAIQFGFTESKL